MNEIIIKGQPVPIHFGMKAVDEFTKRSGSDFSDNVTTTVAVSNLESIVSLTAIGLNEGARKSGSDRRYTEDDVWDIFDEEPTLIVRVSEIFVESITPLTDKLGDLGTDAKPRAKSSSLGLGRGAKEEGERSDPKNGKAAVRKK